MADQEQIDEILGIVRCVRCGHRLEGEVECPFCSLFDEPAKRDVSPKWVFITACFLTSPLSIYFVLKSNRLSASEKAFAASGISLWACFYWWLS